MLLHWLTDLLKLDHEHRGTSAAHISMQICSSTAPLSSSSALVLKFRASSGAERFANRLHSDHSWPNGIPNVAWSSFLLGLVQTRDVITKRTQAHWCKR